MSENQTGENHPSWNGGKETVVCEWCDGTFECHRSSTDRRRFCSRECRGSWMSENRTGENGLHWEGGQVTLNCEWCGDTYTKHECEADESRFCSAECKGAYGGTKTRVERINIACDTCGEQFEVLPHRKGTARFCSNECYAKGREVRSFPYGPEWNEGKRNSIRQRDEFKCQKCGVTQDEHLDEHESKLHVHHITPARTFEDSKKRNDPSNLISLCIRCHMSIEHGNESCPEPTATDD